MPFLELVVWECLYGINFCWLDGLNANSHYICHCLLWTVTPYLVPAPFSFLDTLHRIKLDPLCLLSICELSFEYEMDKIYWMVMLLVVRYRISDAIFLLAYSAAQGRSCQLPPTDFKHHTTAADNMVAMEGPQQSWEKGKGGSDGVADDGRRSHFNQWSSYLYDRPLEAMPESVFTAYATSPKV